MARSALTFGRVRRPKQHLRSARRFSRSPLVALLSRCAIRHCQSTPKHQSPPESDSGERQIACMTNQSRPVTLFTGQWADLPIEALASKCARWGYDGLELACWGDHFEVDRALTDPSYCGAVRELLDRHGLGCWAIGAHLVGQAVSDRRIDERHRAILPADV